MGIFKKLFRDSSSIEEDGVKDVKKYREFSRELNATERGRAASIITKHIFILYEKIEELKNKINELEDLK